MPCIAEAARSALAGVALLLLPLPVAADDAAPMPHFAQSARCSDRVGAPPADACDLLSRIEPLQASPGERVYRETWMGPFEGPMHYGSIVLRISQDGTRLLETPWRHGAYHLRSDELAGFETMLAQSDFANRPVFNQLDTSSGTVTCVDGVATALEAIVDGKYRLVYFDFCGGVSSNSIADALDELFVVAASKAGLQYPVNPQHPTFRGY